MSNTNCTKNLGWTPKVCRRVCSSCYISGTICVILVTKPVILIWLISLNKHNHFDGVMFSVFTSNAVDRCFEPNRGKPKTIKIGICCFSTKHVALRRKSKDWLARNEDNVPEWVYLQTVVPWVSTIKSQLLLV